MNQHIPTVLWPCIRVCDLLHLDTFPLKLMHASFRQASMPAVLLRPWCVTGALLGLSHPQTPTPVYTHLSKECHFHFLFKWMCSYSTSWVKCLWANLISQLNESVRNLGSIFVVNYSPRSFLICFVWLQLEKSVYNIPFVQLGWRSLRFYFQSSGRLTTSQLPEY